MIETVSRDTPKRNPKPFELGSKVGTQRRHTDRSEVKITPAAIKHLEENLSRKGIPIPNLEDAIKEALGKNSVLKFWTRTRFTEFFLNRGSRSADLREDVDKNKIFALVIDGKDISKLSREEGDAVLNIISQQINDSTQGIKGVEVIAAGGDEIIIVSYNQQNLNQIKECLITSNDQNLTTKKGAVANFTVTEVYPTTEPEHQVLMAALFIHCPLEGEEVSVIANDKIKYNELIKKKVAWEQFHNYINQSTENQNKVLAIMAKTNALIGLTLGFVKELNCQREVILSCITPMFFTQETLETDNIEKLVENICAKNVIKSTALVEIALNFGTYILGADPKPKIANNVGMVVGDEVIANTFEILQNQFTEDELKYIIPVTIGPMEFFVLVNPECAPAINSYQRKNYVKLAKRFKGNPTDLDSKIPNQSPITLESPFSMTVTTQVIDIRKHAVELNMISGLLPGLLDYIKTKFDQGWCRDLIQLLNTDKNIEMLIELTESLKNKGSLTLKEYCKQYCKKLGAENLDFARAIMMVNRTEGYINNMLDYLENYNPGLKLITPLNNLLGALVIENSP